MTKPILGGKPLKFETPADLIRVMSKYFEDTDCGEWTVTGLALSMGTSRQLLNDYEARPEYKHIVKEAKSYVEESYEKSLRKHGRSGDIFALKNFGWKDKTEVDTNATLVVYADELDNGL